MTPTDYFAGRVRHYRTAHNWTQPELARRCKEAGLDWDRSIVANVEAGRRASVTVRELLIVAHVLSVPAAVLIFPVGEADEVEVVPGVSVHPDLALRWFLGDEAPMTSAREVAPHADLSMFNRAGLPIRLYGELREAVAAYVNADSDMTQTEFAHGAQSEEAGAARQAYVKALDGVAQVLYRMVLTGVKTPAISRRMLDDMVRLGLSIRQRGERNERDLAKYVQGLEEAATDAS